MHQSPHQLWHNPVRQCDLQMGHDYGAWPGQPATQFVPTIPARETGASPAKRILVIDDDELVCDILSRVLVRARYQVRAVNGAEQALDLLDCQSFDLILCDMQMRGMSGLDLTTAVVQLYPDTPVILITAHRDTDLMRAALRQGAADFIPKPFDSDSIPMIIERTLERRALHHKQAEDCRQEYLFANVQVLAAAIDVKEPFTAQHSRRVARLSTAVANAMGLPPAERQFVDWASQVHDVGKLATPDHILLKPGRLSDDEWRIMRRHPAQGAQIVGQIHDLRYVASIVRSHHERIDGTGYPDRLRGDEIPLLSRIIAVTDAFEVMTSNRVYKGRLCEEDALRGLTESANVQFDAAVVDAFHSLTSDARF